jgi:formate dehydrogenase major subunit
MAEEDARAEGSRCLECGCQDYFECRLIKYANQYNVHPERIEGAKHGEVLKEEHPFMERDSEKCILCGLCVRICEEVMGVTALGLVNRGFESIVCPEFNLPLKDTGCVSCGQCIAVCPTGALTERSTTGKNVPLKLEETPTVCSFCSLECERVVNTRGGRVIRCVPAEGGNLCSKGRFAFEAYNGERLTRPLVRRDGKLVEAGWQDALLYAAQKAQGIGIRNNGSALAVFVSPAYTMEEAHAAGCLGRIALGTDNIATFSRNPARGLIDVFGDGISTNSMDEVLSTDLILMVGSFNESQMAAVKVREAVKRVLHWQSSARKKPWWMTWQL